MSTASDVKELYKNHPVYLWVEDELTRTYLDAAWGAQGTVGILIAGSGDNLRPLVTSARKENYGNVFGLRDRDFESDARAAWSPTQAVLRLDAHEIENFLLDAEALAASPLNTANRTVKEIGDRLRTEADAMTWGMALGATVHWLKRGLVLDFPSPAPLVSVLDEKEARDRIFSTDWWTNTIPSISTALSRAEVEAHLSARHTEFDAMLGSKEWLTRYAGKEILGRVKGYVASSNQTTVEAMAREVGWSQRTQNRVPNEISDLLALLVGVAV